MKNKKIILGLGTITALGAMSVGFIACVKKKEIEDMNLSKLTKEEVAKLLEKVSTLTKEEVAKLLEKVSTLTKEDVKSLIDEGILDESRLVNIFSKELTNYFGSEDDSGKAHRNNNIGHFASGSKVKDVIESINKAIQDKGWTVVEDPQRDNIVGTNTKELIETNGQVLRDGNQEIKFKLKKTLGSLETETEHKINFNLAVGQKDLSTIADKNIHHSAINETKIAEQLNKKEEFKNINLEAKDFEIVPNSKEDPSKIKPGKIKIKAKDDSKKIKGEIELILETVKQELKETHLTGFVATNNTTAQDVKNYINTQTGFKEEGNNISEADFVFAKDDATLDHIGKIKITPKGKTEGESFTIDIPKLIDLKTVIIDKALGELAKKDGATIKAKIKEKNTSIKDDHLEITAITDTTAKVKGKGIYVGEVDVTFKIATTTPS